MNSIDFTTLKPGNYNRKSSEAEDRQMLSIISQIDEAKRIQDFYSLPQFVSTFEESKSAKTEYLRPEFTRMMKMVEKGQIDAIVCWKLDRLARNMTEGGKIIDYLSSGKIKAIITHDKVFYPWDNVIVMSVEFSQGKQYVKDLSINVKRGQAKKARMGYPSSLAALGFVNDMSEEKGNRTWVVDTKRFQILKELFALFLSGTWSVSKLARYARDELQFTTPKHKRIGGCLITRSRMYDILKDPIYAGFFQLGNERYELHTSLPRIISEKEYNLIQQMIQNRSVPKVQKHELTYSGYIQSPDGNFIGQDVKYQIICDCRFKFSYRSKDKCPSCQTSIHKLENPKFLNYSYYYNVKRKKAGLAASHLNETKVDKYLSNYLLKNLCISPYLATWCTSYINELKQDDITRNDTLQKNKESVIERLASKKKRFRQMLSEEYITPDEYKAEMSDIDMELQKISNTKRDMNHWIHEGEKLVNLAQSIKNIFLENDPKEKRMLLSELGSNLSWNEEILSIINTKPVQTLIDGLNEARRINDKFEPDLTLADKDQTEVFASVCPTLRNTWDNVRNAYLEA